MLSVVRIVADQAYDGKGRSTEIEVDKESAAGQLPVSDPAA